MNDQTRNLFNELADLDIAEREKIFAERRIPPELRAEVESLLGFDSEQAHPFASYVSRAADEALASSKGRVLSYCGPYQLVELLGSGGMGDVYLGQRTDGEIQQKVAVKLLRAGADRPAWRERFLRERQLLANLNHPSIARLLDAGHTTDGQPYLVMEYVDGAPIDSYATELDLRHRLLLFVRVCDAVSHAHRHLIIHRDLKPSNILVDQSDHPKLLDFGIAKLLTTPETTQTIERLHTPYYASPEQVRGETQTTATDVYSLGAVLHKLLRGHAPQEAHAPNEPAMVPSDIDCILRKALRTEPDERYTSVDALADDVRAYLESKPVRARAGSAWYHARKFLRRYWLPAAATFAAVIALGVGFAVANHQREIAQRRFDEVRHLSQEFFDFDERIRDLAGVTEARKALVSVSLGYLEGLSRDSRGDLDLMQEVSDGYWRVARIQGVPTGLTLGDFTKAEESLKKADELVDEILQSRPRDRRALERSAMIAHDRMILADSERRPADALAYSRKAMERIEGLLALGLSSESERSSVPQVFANVATASVNMHRYEDAISYSRRLLDLASKEAEAVPPKAISYQLSVLANALRSQGDLGGALKAIQEARTIQRQLTYPDETKRMFDQYPLLLREAFILGEDRGISLDRPAEAIPLLREAFEMHEAGARRDPNDFTSRTRVGTTGRELGDILRWRSPLEAVFVYDVALARLGEIGKNVKARRDTAHILANSSYALRRLKRHAEARRRVDEALAILKETKDYPSDRIALDSELLPVLLAVADQQADEGHTAEAIIEYEQLLEKVMAAKPDVDHDLRAVHSLSLIYQDLFRLCRMNGANSKAEAIEAGRLALWKQWSARLPDNAFVLKQLTATR